LFSGGLAGGDGEASKEEVQLLSVRVLEWNKREKSGGKFQALGK